MALHVYTSEKFIPQEIRLVLWGDSYFDTHTYLSTAPLVTDILWTVDKAKYNNKNSFISRVPEIGALNKNYLSSGTKTLLNIINHPDICFSIETCGGNALDFIPYLHSGNILWRLAVLNYAGDSTECDIILNGSRQYTNIFRFLETLMDGGNFYEPDLE